MGSSNFYFLHHRKFELATNIARYCKKHSKCVTFCDQQEKFLLGVSRFIPMNNTRNDYLAVGLGPSQSTGWRELYFLVTNQGAINIATSFHCHGHPKCDSFWDKHCRHSTRTLHTAFLLLHVFTYPIWVNILRCSNNYTPDLLCIHHQGGAHITSPTGLSYHQKMNLYTSV